MSFGYPGTGFFNPTPKKALSRRVHPAHHWLSHHQPQSLHSEARDKQHLPHDTCVRSGFDAPSPRPCVQLSFNFACSAPGRGVAANIRNAPNMERFCRGS